MIREDPIRKGLLFAGTESSMWMSFDAGDHWQSLQLNLPTTSMRDLEIHGDDLVLATYGRGLWILDDITPLREGNAQIEASAAHLFKPAPVVRFHWDINEDTPLPIETPTSPNPPEGAIVDYYLKNRPSHEITMTITDARGGVVRQYSSVASPPGPLKANVPSYWFAASDALPSAAGMNRFAWNLRYETPKILPFSYYGGLLNYIEYTLAEHAIAGHTPATQPEGAMVVPGTYKVTLTVDGQRYEQALTVAPDPRVRATPAQLTAQVALARQMTIWMEASYDGYNQVNAFRASLAALRQKFAGSTSQAGTLETLTTLDSAAAPIENTAPGSFGIINRDLTRVFSMVTSGDAPPASEVKAMAIENCEALAKTVAAWKDLSGRARTLEASLGGSVAGAAGPGQRMAHAGVWG